MDGTKNWDMIQIQDEKSRVAITHLPKLNKKATQTETTRADYCSSINNVKYSRSSRKFGLISAY